ncbi:unnamed protein product [Cladocopium goreaui]|uniref:1-alkyl-2-acetylglycerophosphocholine esterase n=1 Tax=Cladocopium goreaui TaxID=2562237 RepID=A0A9P1FT82_9DINO|nr:unnamed protein product [Cladocopium goreaui]
MLSILRKRRPRLEGDQFIGSLRVRMPLEEGVKDLQVQVHYPGNKDGELLTNDRFPLMRPEVLQAIGDAKGIPASALRSLFGGSMQEDPSCEVSTASKWPIAVFTSGSPVTEVEAIGALQIWGSCEMYTQFLRDLASYGMVVIAIEHEEQLQLMKLRTVFMSFVLRLIYSSAADK